jgi:glucosamine kinase
MAFYLGIDGGGTKTRCLLGDETTVIARSTAGGSNVVRLGEQSARDALHIGIKQVCASANVSPSKIDAVCMGAAGAARPEIAAMLRQILLEITSGTASINIEVTGDMEIALEAAFGSGPGVMAIAGTGSIVYGRDSSGRVARAGGWGFAISDEGSGHWIGRRAISGVLSAHDRNAKTALTAMVLHAWKLESLDQLVLQANKTPAPDFPRLFPIVLHAAEGHDAVARNVLEAAGKELAFLMKTVLQRLTTDASAPPLPVATTGSVFRQSQIVRQVFYNEVQANFPGVTVRQEPVDPVEGALARARRMRA